MKSKETKIRSFNEFKKRYFPNLWKKENSSKDPETIGKEIAKSILNGIRKELKKI